MKWPQCCPHAQRPKHKHKHKQANDNPSRQPEPNFMDVPAQATLLVVDDATETLSVLSDLLLPHYRVRVATSGVEGLRLANIEPQPALIFLDVMMPVMDGYAVLAQLRASEHTRDIPVIFLTAMAEAEDIERGLQLGAADYITKPCSPIVVMARVKTQLEAKQARDWMKTQNAVLEAEVARRMAENDLTQRASIHALAHLAEIRDLDTGNHLLRTQGYVRQLALGLQQHPRDAAILTPRFIELLARSAPLHDIGKVGIPDHILLKRGGLTGDEMIIMRTHAKLGSDAIEMAERDIATPLPFFAIAKEIAHWHHEKWDGSGYPDGLAGEAIPLAARLMALADVFDALISVRVYKPAMPFEQAHALILAGRGKHFDPEIVDAFEANFPEFVAIAQRYQDKTPEKSPVC
jgi:putative two-component system response regulator